jgi:hypothetical protein
MGICERVNLGQRPWATACGSSLQILSGATLERFDDRYHYSHNRPNATGRLGPTHLDVVVFTRGCNQLATEWVLQNSMRVIV